MMSYVQLRYAKLLFGWTGSAVRVCRNPHGRIITTLEPEKVSVASVASKSKHRKDWVSVVDEIVKASNPLRGVSPLQSAAFALLRASAQVAQLAVRRPEATNEIWPLGIQLQKSLTRLQRVLERAER